MSPRRTEKSNSVGRKLLLSGQFGVSAGLIHYALSKVDATHAISLALNVDAWFLLLSAVLLIVQQALLAIRWIFIVRGIGGALSLQLAVRYVWIGSFFNQVLPTSIGGDVVRTWLYWTRCRSRRIAIQSVVLERLIAMIALLLLVLAV